MAQVTGEGGPGADAGAVHCPHCLLPIEAGANGPWPPRPTRCPHCRLMIGPGRARDEAAEKPGARGAAAGVFAQRAKQEGAARAVSPERVRAAIRRVAADVGARPERLLMVDYQQRASADASLPGLSDVFAVFGSWKRARREAGGE